MLTLHINQTHSCSSFHSLWPPSSSNFQHIHEIRESFQHTDLTDTGNLNPLTLITPSSCKTAPPIMISCGLPPVPAKLVKRIQDGLFVEMSELLPDKLTGAEYNTEEDHTSSQKQKHEVLSIMEWVQCFGIFIAVLSRTVPDRTAGLLGYQHLIIQASSRVKKAAG